MFGVKESLVCALEWHPAGSVTGGRVVAQEHAVLRYDFVLARE